MYLESMYQLGAKRSGIRELFEHGLRRTAEVGAENVYDFSLGNPSVPAPEEVRQAFMREAAREDSVAVHGYTPAAGDMEARRAIAEDITVRSGMDVHAENIFVTCGAAPALIACIHALAVPEAEFVLLAPYFPEYTMFVGVSGSKSVVVPAEADFQLHPEKIAPYLTEHTQAVLLNSPNNPSGVIYSRASLEALGALLREKSAAFGHPIYLISDEPYRELAYDGTEVPYVPSIYENTIICYSWSKSLSLPGERIGYVCVPDCAADHEGVFYAIAGAARMAGHVCAPAMQQHVVKACLRARPDLAAYDRNRQTLYRALTEYGYECVYPQGAFYMMVKAPCGSSAAFSERAKQRDLLIVPGDSFGCPAYFRVSTCVSHEMILRSLPVFRALIEESR